MKEQRRNAAKLSSPLLVFEPKSAFVFESPLQLVSVGRLKSSTLHSSSSVARRPRLSSPIVLVIPFPDELMFCLPSVALVSDSRLRLLSVALVSDSPSSSLSR
ncbi:hypothetical protein CDL15_Pgr026007 [Punica granatum]|nr:hypothetical protein CDL15_Pgr026007 [Punica granatum]